jgi:hypothetical protein
MFMRKLQLIVLALGLISVAWGNACTSAANGNWNAAASWSNCGGSYPADGDTVTVTHIITITANATVGNSPSDAINAAPTLPVIQLQRTNGTTSNGQLTINGGVTFTVKGSVAFAGTTGSGTGLAMSPILTMQPGATWTFDNSANQTAVYRMYATTHSIFAYINVLGTGWAPGNYVVFNGRPPSCSSCAGAILTTESSTAVTGSNYGGFRQNYNYTQFWYFGSSTDAYRSMNSFCGDADHEAGQQFYMVNVEWHYSSGLATPSAYFPCTYTDYKVQYIRTMNSTTANGKGFYQIFPIGSPVTGKDRTLQYAYFDTGMDQGGGNSIFTGFRTVSYLVMDKQSSAFGPSAGANPALFPNVDHMLVRESKSYGGSGSWAFGSTSYLLDVVDGGVGNQHSISTFSTTSGSYGWVMDHVVWQDGETNSSDTDAIEARPQARNGFPTTWNYFLMLPNAAKPQYTSHTIGAYQYTAASNAIYNHAVFAFGKNYAGTGGISGAIYLGETDCGTARTIGMKNSILWNPNPSAGESPLYAWVVGSCNLNSFVANAYDPLQIHNNLVYNYGTNSNRWSASAGACGGSNCTSYGTPYDVPTTGTAPGANDIHQAPQFVWQQQGITAPGVREWAHIQHGAAYDSNDTSTEAHFANAFALFGAADPGDTSTTAGMKGLIDEMFAWIYAEWSATNPALKGAADDGSDIGAAPVTILCPSAYPAATVSGCNSLAQAGRPSDAGSSAYSAGGN